MGMYTGLRGRIKLKDNHLSSVLIQKDFIWLDVANTVYDETISAWANVGRHDFIPNGAVCYMPDGWGEGWAVEDNVLTFTCSLKNYEDEIETFIRHVLPHIADAWNLEYLYEESSHSTLVTANYEQKEFNVYKFYDDYTGEEIEQKRFVDVFSIELI